MGAFEYPKTNSRNGKINITLPYFMHLIGIAALTCDKGSGTWICQTCKSCTGLLFVETCSKILLLCVICTFDFMIEVLNMIDVRCMIDVLRKQC